MPSAGGNWRNRRSIGGHVRFDVPNAARDLCHGTGRTDFQAVGTAVGTNECTGHRDAVERLGRRLGGHGHSTGSIGGNDVDWDPISIYIGVDLCAGVALSAA